MKFRPPGVASALVRRRLGGAGDLGLEVAETPFRGALGAVGPPMLWAASSFWTAAHAVALLAGRCFTCGAQG